MGEPENGSDWNRFRGEVVARLNNIERDIDSGEAWRHEHERYAQSAESRLYDQMHKLSDDLKTRISAVEVRVAVYAAVGSITGAGVVMILQWIVKGG